MAHYFRVMYRTDEDGRRTTRFFEAEETASGFMVNFPADFVAQLRHLEAVSIFDEAKMPMPVKREPTPEAIAWAEREAARILAERAQDVEKP
jgi:hypothetical protein